MHYLYTGTFQTLQSQDNDDKTAQLRRNVLLYCIATNYGLSDLATLGREKIQNTEGEVAIFDTLNIIKKAFQTMLEDDADLTPYIKREIKTAFEIDSGFLEKDTFIELFGEAKHFDRILMRIAAELFTERMAAISENTQLTSNGSSSEAIDAPGNSSRLSQQETLSEEPAATIIEERAVPEKAPTDCVESYAMEYATCEALPPKKCSVCEDPPKCEKPARFIWDTWGTWGTWGQLSKVAAPSEEPSSGPNARLG